MGRKSPKAVANIRLNERPTLGLGPDSEIAIAARDHDPKDVLSFVIVMGCLLCSKGVSEVPKYKLLFIFIAFYSLLFFFEKGKGRCLSHRGLGPFDNHFGPSLI